MSAVAMWPDKGGFEIGNRVQPNCGGPMMVIIDLFPYASAGLDGPVTTARARWITEGSPVLVGEFIAPVACFVLVTGKE